jgi:hypothetical protein
MLDKRSAFLCLKNGHFPRVFLPCCHLVRNGVMNLEALYEPPFTDIHYEGLDRGPRGPCRQNHFYHQPSERECPGSLTTLTALTACDIRVFAIDQSKNYQGLIRIIRTPCVVLYVVKILLQT